MHFRFFVRRSAITAGWERGKLLIDQIYSLLVQVLNNFQILAKKKKVLNDLALSSNVFMTCLFPDQNSFAC